MRQQRILSLHSARGDVRVLEATIGDLRRLLDLLPDEGEPGDLLGHVRRHIPDYLALLADSLTLPPGITLDQLTLSELDAILRDWWEINRGFFDQALALLGLTLTHEPTAPSSSDATPARSINASPPSACADTTAPGTGAGGISAASST